MKPPKKLFKRLTTTADAQNVSLSLLHNSVLKNIGSSIRAEVMAVTVKLQVP
jgi:hypothetical protein